HALQRLLGRDAHDRLAGLLADLEGVDRVLRQRLRGEQRQARQAEEPARSSVNGAGSGFLGIHRFASTNCSALWRSTQSPVESCTSSLRLIWASSIAVITPKFWPM